MLNDIGQPTYAGSDHRPVAAEGRGRYPALGRIFVGQHDYGRTVKEIRGPVARDKAGHQLDARQALESLVVLLQFRSLACNDNPVVDATPAEDLDCIDQRIEPFIFLHPTEEQDHI